MRRCRVTMPFGKYAGRCLEDLPDSYLAWLLSIDLRGGLRFAVAEEWERRHHRYADPPDPPTDRHLVALEPDQVVLARDLIQAGYRTLARQVHPDTGGSHEQMQ